MVTLESLGVTATSGQHRVKCPECQSRKKTLGVDATRGIFHCFRCGFAGRIGDSSQWYGKHIQNIEAAEKQRAEARKNAALKAWKLWNGAPAAGDHPYLIKKKLPGIGLRERDGKLLIPMVNTRNQIQNLQTIDANGKKLFLKGGAVTGLFFKIPNDGTTDIYICEGVATGLAIHVGMRPGSYVICAFSANNLSPVAINARKLFPNRNIIIAADNDWLTKGNPGVS
jgi:putative DNA primase/helicase